MHSTTTKLLRAASEMVGGDTALARRLGIDEALLSTLMSGQYELPERVLLGVVDIILAKHESKYSLPRRRAATSGPDSTVVG